MLAEEINDDLLFHSSKMFVFCYKVDSCMDLLKKKALE